MFFKCCGIGGELNLGTLAKIVIGWLTTIPLAMLVSLGTFEALTHVYLSGGHGGINQNNATC